MRAPARWTKPCARSIKIDSTAIDVGEQARLNTTKTKSHRRWMHAQNKLKMIPNRRWMRPNRRWMLTTTEMKYREMQVHHQEYQQSKQT